MRPQQFTDEEMIAAARRCFLELGPGAATSEVAKRLGVSPAALFRRVGSKRELLIRALAPPTMPPFVPTLNAGPDDRPVLEQLESIAVEIDTFFASLFPVIAIMRAAGINPREVFEGIDDPPPVKAVVALSEWFCRLAEQQRVTIGDPVSVAMAFIGGLHGRHFMRHACGAALPHSEHDSPQTFARIFFHGIALRPATASDQEPNQ